MVLGPLQAVEAQLAELAEEDAKHLAGQTTTKCQFAGTLPKPSDGLEPSTPSLPWNVSSNRWQPIATDLACFCRFCAQAVCR
jgi:hypothetical protein